MSRSRIQWPWLITGSLVLTLVLVVSIFPHLLTTANPLHRQYANYQTGQSAPFPPSKIHPFGTDLWGRDLLAMTLAGTVPTLIPAAIVTLCIVLGSLILGTMAAVNESPWFRGILRWLNQLLVTLPVLFLLILSMTHQVNNGYVTQFLQYLLWITIFEIGRSSYAFSRNIEEWMGAEFVTASIIAGRSRFRIVMKPLRPWLARFTAEFTFTEFARVLSLMTVLAAFHIYPMEHMADIPFVDTMPPIVGIQSVNLTWISILGDATNNGAYMSYPYYLYGPVLFILATVIGTSWIARGVRGTSFGLEGAAKRVRKSVTKETGQVSSQSSRPLSSS